MPALILVYMVLALPFKSLMDPCVMVGLLPIALAFGMGTEANQTLYVVLEERFPKQVTTNNPEAA